MCTKTKCRKCGKASWSGCGQHVDSVLQGIPQSQRCQGHEGEAKAPGLLARLLGKR